LCRTHVRIRNASDIRLARVPAPWRRCRIWPGAALLGGERADAAQSECRLTEIGTPKEQKWDGTIVGRSVPLMGPSCPKATNSLITMRSQGCCQSLRVVRRNADAPPRRQKPIRTVSACCGKQAMCGHCECLPLTGVHIASSCDEGTPGADFRRG